MQPGAVGLTTEGTNLITYMQRFARVVGSPKQPRNVSIVARNLHNYVKGVLVSARGRNIAPTQPYTVCNQCSDRHMRCVCCNPLDPWPAAHTGWLCSYCLIKG